MELIFSPAFLAVSIFISIPIFLFGYVRVKCGISKVSVFSIGYQYSKILLKVIHINCSKDLIIFFHT